MSKNSLTDLRLKRRTVYTNDATNLHKTVLTKVPKKYDQNYVNNLENDFSFETNAVNFVPRTAKISKERGRNGDANVDNGPKKNSTMHASPSAKNKWETNEYEELRRNCELFVFCITPPRPASCLFPSLLLPAGKLFLFLT